MKSKHRIIIIVAVLLLVPIGYQCNRVRYNPIRIGFVSALSGPSADLGFSSRNAFELYIDKINLEGGINGRPIEMIVLDDQGDPDVALSLFKQLIADDIKLIVGQVTSASGALSIPYINEQDALFISPLISSTAYRGTDDHFIALAPSASSQGSAISDYIVSQNSSSKVAIIYDQSNIVYSNSVVEGVAEKLESTKYQLYPLDDVSEISNVVANAAQFEPDDFVVITSVSDLILISNQVKKTLSDVNIYSSMWGMVPEVISGYGKGMANVYGVYAINPNSNSPKFLDFKKRYKEKYKVEANFGAIYTYNSAHLLVSAIEHTNSTNPDEIKAYIKETQFFEGINTPYEITSTGDAIRKMFIIHAEDGKTIN